MGRDIKTLIGNCYHCGRPIYSVLDSEDSEESLSHSKIEYTCNCNKSL